MQTTLPSCCCLKTSRSQCSVSQQQREPVLVEPGRAADCCAWSWILEQVISYHRWAPPSPPSPPSPLSSTQLSSGFCSQSSLETIRLTTVMSRSSAVTTRHSAELGSASQRALLISQSQVIGVKPTAHTLLVCVSPTCCYF